MALVKNTVKKNIQPQFTCADPEEDGDLEDSFFFKAIDLKRHDSTSAVVQMHNLFIDIKGHSLHVLFLSITWRTHDLTRSKKGNSEVSRRCLRGDGRRGATLRDSGQRKTRV